MPQDSGLVIDWVSMPTYNTIMALATGAVLMSLAKIGQQLFRREHINPLGWSLNLGVLGILLFATGLHMTLTWPLAKYFPFDNIVFGEPALALGTIALGLSFYFYKTRSQIISAIRPFEEVAQVVWHIKYLLYGLGLALIAIGIAGVTYQLFAAPPEEPITGLFADYPMIEATFISLLWALTGVASILMPSVLKYFTTGSTAMTSKLKISYGLLYGLGIVFLLFGAFNYFTHIGLIVNTMPN